MIVTAKSVNYENSATRSIRCNSHRADCNTLCDVTPYVMEDGSILFTRWEYQGKNIFCTRGLWTINPDGTRLQLFYGNTLVVPNSIYGARQIPGTRKLVCTMAPHHGRPLGAIGVIDRSRGIEDPKSIVNITPEIPYEPALAANWKIDEREWQPGDVQYQFGIFSGFAVVATPKKWQNA